MSDIVERLERFAKEGAGVSVLIDAAEEIKRLRAALQKIANPVGYLRDYAKEQGRELDGHMAIQISKDPGWLSSEAAKALSSSDRGSQ